MRTSKRVQALEAGLVARMQSLMNLWSEFIKNAGTPEEIEELYEDVSKSMCMTPLLRMWLNKWTPSLAAEDAKLVRSVLAKEQS